MSTVGLPVRLLLIVLGGPSLSGCERQADAVAKEVPGAVAAAGTLVRAGAMGSARAAHTATVLADQRILLAGGMTGEEDTAAGAELYDPVSGTFRATGPMVTPRHSHTATPLSDGTVLVAGGYDARGTYLRSAEIYHPRSGRFTGAGSLREARAGHAGVALRDGRVLLVGGVGEGWTFLSSAELYDPATGTFAPTGGMSLPRESHAAVRLPDGRVLVVGGHQGRGAAIQLHPTAEIFDPDRGTFSAGGSMSVRRHKHDAVLLRDGRVLVTGGADERDDQGVYASTELYDPRRGTFGPGSAMRLPRFKHAGTSVTLADGRVLLAGGAAQAEVFDPRTGGFTAVAGEARLAGQFSAAAPLPGGGALITGGYGGNRGPRREAWIYRP